MYNSGAVVLFVLSFYCFVELSFIKGCLALKSKKDVKSTCLPQAGISRKQKVDILTNLKIRCSLINIQNSKMLNAN
jgi:hypothetical protein